MISVEIYRDSWTSMDINRYPWHGYPWISNACDHMGPKKYIKKEAILSKNDDVGRLSRFPERKNGFICWKMNLLDSSWNGTLAFNKKRGPIWRYLVMKWISNISKKHENRLPPCPVRPNPAKVRGNRVVWSMPCPQTPPDLTNST